MSSSGSVTNWLMQLKAGNSAAAQPLWERYFRRLVGQARARLKGLPRRVADEEDVALSAFHSFCRAAEQGRFPNLEDRDDLFRILLLLTARKALHLRRDENAQKRGGGRVLTEADLASPDDEDAALAQVYSDEPTPEMDALVTEECGRLLGLLPEVLLRQIAVGRMEGYSIKELAKRFNCSPAKVARKLERIREYWVREVPS
jgi:DNA-directed RNA polymerase specialized sigma24 family protein